MFELYYDSTSAELYKINKDTKEKTLLSEMASEPVYSPNKERALYISPLEWECIGDLFLISLGNGTIATLDVVKDKEDFTPKFVNWLDDNKFVVIIGFAYGTVSVGGDVYLVNINEVGGQINLLDSFPSTIQVTAVDVLRNGDLLYTGIEYIDENYISSIPFRFRKNSDEIFSKLVVKL